MISSVLDSIPFRIETAQIQKILKIQEENELIAKLNLLISKAEAIGRPKAFYKVSSVEFRGENQVSIDGITLTSRVLQINLEKAHRVFPFVATCGLELEAGSKSIDDPLEKHWADVIMETALHNAIRHLSAHLIDHFQLGKIARMNPGSLPDWPLEEQRPLFAIMEKGPGSVGIALLDSLFMEPIKSVSGIWFPTEENFESCQLCPIENCRGRRAPYDSGLYNRKYR
jgi:hypothetical protein